MEIILFNEKTIREFLRSHWRGSSTKDYEFLVAIILNRFYQEQCGENCVIGFKLKDKYSRDLPSQGSTSIEQIRDILRAQIDEDSPIDVIIVPGSVTTGKKYGPAFQLKRFGKGLSKRDTDTLIEYLNSIPSRYAKVNASLFLILETGEMLDFKKVRNLLVTKNYPFNRIMFMSVSDGKLYIGEFWPNAGMNEYNPKEFLGN